MSRSRSSWIKCLRRSLFPAARNRQLRRSCRLSIEALEDRLTPNSYLVNVATDSSGSTGGSGTGTTGDLRYCLNRAIHDHQTDTITFAAALAGQTIILNSSLVTEPGLIGLEVFSNHYGRTAFILDGNNISIDGTNAPGLIISGGNATRLFAVAGGGTLTLKNLTLLGGNSTGGAGGVENGGGDGGGGAGLGGAVLVDGSTFTADGCTFANNVASGGAGGSGGTSQSGVSVAGGAGGDLGNVPSNFNVSPGSFGGGGNGGIPSGVPGGAGGFGGGGGGAGNNYSANSTANGGSGGAGGFGGGGGGGGAIVTHDIGQHARRGPAGVGGFGGGQGGIGVSTSTSHIAEFSYDNAGGGGGGGLGGAVFSNGGTLTLTNDTFTKNSASGAAGGLQAIGRGIGNASGSAGQGDGGAVFLRNGSLTATFDTFSSNTVTNGDKSSGTGSDIYVLSDDSNGGNNTSPGNGDATVTLIDDILGQNGTTTVDDFFANTNDGSLAPNQIDSSNDLISLNATGANALTGTAITTGTPNFSTVGLANNGGPSDTIALTSSSTLALGQASTETGITTDQRGFARGRSGVDLGAFQLEGLALTATLPGAGVHTAYKQTISVTKSSGPGGPYTFAVTTGALPVGLSLSQSGVLAGTPTTAGSFSFTVTAMSSVGLAGSQAYTFTVTPAVTASTANLAADLTQITIHGFGFEPTASDNTVTFNDGAVGTVTAATATSLTVAFSTKPTTAGDLMAVVFTEGISTALAVQVATVRPVVTDSTASLAINAPQLTIEGFGFDPTAADNRVSFSDGAVGTVTAATATSLTVTISTRPTTAGSLTAVVASDKESSGTAVQVAAVMPVVTASTTNLAANATQITIHGIGFSPIAANNTVTLNDGAVGTVIAETATSLTVTFSTRPVTAGSLTVVVTTNKQRSGLPVQVETVTPVVTASTANLATDATRIMIRGLGFDPTAANNTVTFNDGAVGTVSAATPTALTVALSSGPTTAGSLTAVVTIDNQSSNAAVQVARVVPPITPPTIKGNTGSLLATANSLTIKGNGFSTTAANNRVVFPDGAIGTVTAATATSLTVTFSTKPTTAGPMTAVVFTEGVSSGTDVWVATVLPVVTASIANLAATANQITIRGFGFDPTPANNAVSFNHALGTVIEATPTSLIVTFSIKPTKSGILTAVVNTDNESSGTAVQVATVP